MKDLRSRLTYANVMATIAVFVALGGASYAATKLPKNSVGSKQIKKDAVVTTKIKKGAVTGAKIKTSSLGIVPTAANATHADTAANATHADSAAVASSIAPPEAPHLVGALDEPPFAGEWENNGGSLTPISFYKDREGVVHLEGIASSNNLADLVFTLPSGYRPNGDQLFEAFGYPNGAGDAQLVTIKASGQVHAGNSLEVSLSGITFRAG